jgi:mannose-1-phosphate guanylyltransferase/mannose-6-phosphate isomerase
MTAQLETAGDWITSLTLSGEHMADLIIPAILVGGVGARLWPLSRTDRPKQFLALNGDRSLFQNTVLRVRAAEFARPWIMTHESQAPHVDVQLPDIDVTPEGMILEPIQRGTASAIAALTCIIGRHDPDALVLVMPADHFIADAKLFRETVLRAKALAKYGKIVTFGIVPTSPETGYGYVRCGEGIVLDEIISGYAVVQPGGFVEKPSAFAAQEFIAAGYCWNAGVFLFKASVMRREFEKHAPLTLDAASAAVARGTVCTDLNTICHGLDESAFSETPKGMSVDTAIIEVSQAVAVVPCDDIGWSDVGSLASLWDTAQKDDANNVVVGNGFVHQSHGVLIYSETNRKIVSSHLDGMMIIDTADALIVIPKDKAQAVKGIVEALSNENAPEVAITNVFQAIWGQAVLVARDQKYLVATVTLNASRIFKRLSIAASSETWVALDDDIECVLESTKTVLSRGQSLTVEQGLSIAFVAPNRPVKLAAIFATCERLVSLKSLLSFGVSPSGR